MKVIAHDDLGTAPEPEDYKRTKEVKKPKK